MRSASVSSFGIISTICIIEKNRIDKSRPFFLVRSYIYIKAIDMSP